MEVKVYLADDIEGFALFFDSPLFLLKSLIQFFWGKNILHGYFQSNNHLIHLVDLHQSYFIYFQLCNVLKILHNKNRLIYCIFHCRMLRLVFPYSDQC